MLATSALASFARYIGGDAVLTWLSFCYIAFDSSRVLCCTLARARSLLEDEAFRCGFNDNGLTDTSKTRLTRSFTLRWARWV
jgi:hypothetical protein